MGDGRRMPSAYTFKFQQSPTTVILYCASSWLMQRYLFSVDWYWCHILYAVGRWITNCWTTYIGTSFSINYYLLHLNIAFGQIIQTKIIFSSILKIFTYKFNIIAIHSSRCTVYTILGCVIILYCPNSWVTVYHRLRPYHDKIDRYVSNSLKRIAFTHHFTPCLLAGSPLG